MMPLDAIKSKTQDLVDVAVPLRSRIVSLPNNSLQRKFSQVAEIEVGVIARNMSEACWGVTMS
jgi:hypothetical protein